MPIVQIDKLALCECLNRKDFTEQEIDELCFEFGLELDEVTSEREMVAKEQGDAKAKEQQLSDAVIYKIEVPANRYDLLCVEGLSMGLMVFQGVRQPPKYSVKPPSSPDKQRIIIQPITKQVRPIVVGAVLRGVKFTPSNYRSFIDLQDKLHHTICRKRSLASVGTHDLDTVQGPFVYTAQAPGDIHFQPLGQSQSYTAEQLMQLYSGESHLKPYLPIIRDSPVYPVIRDSNGTVLSLPPIINSEHSKITLSTRNVLIEVTATDRHKASVVLDTIVCAFSQYCSEQFTVEQLLVQESDGDAAQNLCPQLECRPTKVSVDYLRQGVGKPALPVSEICGHLGRMCLLAQPVAASDSDDGQEMINVVVPPTRHDVLHACDILEDLAIAIGYNNLTETPPPTLSTGSQQPINSLTDKLRQEVAFAGFTECLTFALCSRSDISDKLGLELNSLPAVHIANPKTLEFQVARTSLLPGILKTVHSNRSLKLPLKLFEIQDIVIRVEDAAAAPDGSSTGGARNCRQLAAIFYGKTSGFELIHGLLDRVLQVLSVKPEEYKLVISQSPTFFTGRCADVVLVSDGSRVGTIGVLHPDTLAKFELNLPASALVFDVERFL